ncbi:hypothetical protein OH809_39010 [Streptomyces sp. NBC_00873]|uniref:hypothetical protein n=1 Tax=unclassified Streptomyces TaxID=2593676 RepID=UPI00386C5BEB|nr:hypothetical protein OH809_39010 [Streptomyces sp. NBC_00873]WTA42029.1 hypothetical protein OH821_04680 [Streptomyces sp. NBC_00842]
MHELFARLPLLPALFRLLLVKDRVAGAVLDAGDIQTVGEIGEGLGEPLRADLRWRMRDYLGDCWRRFARTCQMGDEGLLTGKLMLVS